MINIIRTEIERIRAAIANNEPPPSRTETWETRLRRMLLAERMASNRKQVLTDR